MSHQAALGALTAHYAGDPRLLAFSLFGSLARGDCTYTRTWTSTLPCATM